MNNSLRCNEVSKSVYLPVHGQAKKHGHYHTLDSKLSAVFYAIAKFCTNSSTVFPRMEAWASISYPDLLVDS